jgi:hypothetical protein
MLFVLVLVSFFFMIDARAEGPNSYGRILGSHDRDAIPKAGYGYRNRDGTTNYAPIVPRHGEIAVTPPPPVSPLRSPPPRASDPPYQMLQEQSPKREYRGDSRFSDRVK